jgi:hypothetical protein
MEPGYEQYDSVLAISVKVHEILLGLRHISVRNARFEILTAMLMKIQVF